MKKQLIYLDQSYLSAMAKEEAGLTRSAHAELGRAMGELLQVLRRLVNRDRLVCPSSAVHDQESDLDSRLAPGAHALLGELSAGCHFSTYVDIEFGQTLRALNRYLGLPADPEDGRWQHAFVDNPHRPLERPRFSVHMPLPAAFVADDRQRKALMQEFRLTDRSKQAAMPRVPFPFIREAQFAGVARQRYYLPLIEYLPTLEAIRSGGPQMPELAEEASDEEFLAYLNRIVPPPAYWLAGAYLKLAAGEPERERYWQFFESDHFGAIPYYDIFCSLEAGFIAFQPSRLPRASDPYDFAALASVLPYVDVVTTDRSMKAMLVHLGLHHRYGVEVYSAQAKDVRALRERLS